MELAQGTHIDRWGVDSRQDVQHLAVRSADVTGDIAVQGARGHVSVAEVDANYGHRPHALPGRFEIAIDDTGDVLAREQHGPRQASVRSAKLLIHPSQHLKEQDRLARTPPGGAGSGKILMP